MNEIKVSVIRYADRNALLLKFVDPVTGQRKTKSAGTNIMRDAERAAAKWENQLREGVPDCGKVTWQYFRQRYEGEVLPSLADGTAGKVSAVFNAVEKHVAPVRLRDLTAERVSYLQSKLREAKLSENTIKGNLAHLMAALRWAARVGLLVKVPAVTMPKRAKGANMMKGRPITLEEFERMLAKVEAGLLPDGGPSRWDVSNWNAPTRITSGGLAAYQRRAEFRAAESAPSWQHLLPGLWASGLRIGEALELTWDDDSKLRVDLQPGEHPMLRIPRELEKGNQDRLLPLAPEFAEFLLETPEHKRTGFVFNPRPRSPKCKRLGVQAAIRDHRGLWPQGGR
jgi:integrase